MPQKPAANKIYVGRVTFTPPDKTNTTAARIPAKYSRHRKVFDKEKSQQLPQHTIWDHTIELNPEAPRTLLGRLLPLTQKEIMEVHKFVAEHLKRETIQESWSPYAANFFFVKKKDGKLQPVQDYRPLNKWTIKIGMSHHSSHRLLINLVDAPFSQSLTSDGDTTTSTSRKAMNGKQCSLPLKDYSSQQSCSLA